MRDIRNATSSTSRSNRVPILRAQADPRRYRNREKEIEERVEAYERGGRDSLRQEMQVKRKERKSWRFEMIGFLAVLVIGAIVYMLTFVFNSADINIKARAENISQTGNITLNNNASNTQFEIYEIKAKDTVEVKKSSTVDIKAKAKGYVTIYNNYDSKSQKLVKNTRLSTSDGKIFRIDSTVIVPGKTGQTPGSIKVLAVADTYGGEYNIAATQFTIPGLKGTPKYNGFYAKSDTNMTGGDVGKRYLISAQDLKDAESKLMPKLESKLRDEVRKYKDENYIAIYETFTINYNNNRADIEKQPDINTLEEEAVARVVIVKKSTIANAIARLNISSYNGNDSVSLRNYDVLHLGFAGDNWSSSTVTISAEYRGDLVWNVDANKIKSELVGKKVDEFGGIMSRYVGVDTAKPVFRPMWVHTFPNTEKRIEVKID